MLKLIVPLLFWIPCLIQNAFADSSLNSYIEKKVDEPTARAVCGDTPVTKVDGLFACAVCPSYVEVAIPEPMVLQKMVLGKFSSPKAKERVVDTEGCEPHSNNFGGMILLEEQEGKLQRRYYQPGYRLNECLKFESSKGRDVLVCNEVFQAQGSVIGQFAAFRFGDSEATWRELQSWIYTEDSENAIEPTSARQTDLNDDGILDLVLTFSARASKESVKNIKIDYLFDGQVFKLADTNKATKKELDKLFDQWN